jgi:hypothetical protein
MSVINIRPARHLPLLIVRMFLLVRIVGGMSVADDHIRPWHAHIDLGGNCEFFSAHKYDIIEFLNNY